MAKPVIDNFDFVHELESGLLFGFAGPQYLFSRTHILSTASSMPRDPLIGLVGKPSSGKSTTLNRYAVPLQAPQKPL